MKRVLVPHDGSATSASILAHVRRLTQGQETEAILLRVVEPGAESDARRQMAAASLAEVESALEAEGLNSSFKVYDGDPAEGILEAVKELKPDLLAMSTHGRSGLSRLLRGSVAERVMRNCPVPILLCNPNTQDLPAFGRILVALDGSQRAEQALPLVHELARRERSTVVLLTIEEWLYSETEQPAPDPDSLWNEQHQQQRLGLIEGARANLEAAGITVETQAAHGVPAHEILEAADHADLVVMTTHGRTGAARWLFGSVAETVARACTRPLLVVRTVASEG